MPAKSRPQAPHRPRRRSSTAQLLRESQARNQNEQSGPLDWPQHSVGTGQAERAFPRIARRYPGTLPANARVARISAAAHALRPGTTRTVLTLHFAESGVPALIAMLISFRSAIISAASLRLFCFI